MLFDGVGEPAVVPVVIVDGAEDVEVVESVDPAVAAQLGEQAAPPHRVQLAGSPTSTSRHAFSSARSL
jgi:hypothetical protein